MQVGGIYEQRDAQSLTYILEDTSLFYSTGYKVLKSQEGMGFVKCNHLTHNGRDKLVYDISRYKELSSLATMLDGVAFLSVFANLLDSLINAKNNGFMQYDNIDISFDKIFVDCNNYKVYLVYLPLEIGPYNNDIYFLEERFRYSISNFFQNYFQNPDENIIYINNVISSSQNRFEDMREILLTKIKELSNNSGKMQNNSSSKSGFNMNMNTNTNVNTDINTNANTDRRINYDDRDSRRMKNNPMRNSTGDVNETMDISDLLKQIRKNGYYDEIGENTCFENLDSYGMNAGPRNTNQNRLNLGGTPGSLSRANNNEMNNMAHSGMLPNVRRGGQGRNTNNDYGRNRDFDRDMQNFEMSRYDRDYDDRDFDNRNRRRNYDDRGHGRGRDIERNVGRNNSRGNYNSKNRGINRTINATIRLVGDKETGGLELIVDKEEFSIGKNFNVVDGFIPHNEGISRVHCKIVYDRGGYHIVDMGSLNGTYVNGARIPAKSLVPISIGDKIGIANLEFSVEPL